MGGFGFKNISMGGLKKSLGDAVKDPGKALKDTTLNYMTGGMGHIFEKEGKKLLGMDNKGNPAGALDAKRLEMMKDNTGRLIDIKAPELKDIALQKYAKSPELQAKLLEAAPQLQLERYQNAPDLSLQGMGPSALQGVNYDQGLQDDQRNVLSFLKDTAQQGGFNAQDRARLADAQSQADTAARGRREAAMRNARASGTAGGGLDFLNQLQANQSAANQASKRSMDVAGMANDRATNMMLQSGQAARQLSQDQARLDTQKASATDAISRFNTDTANRAAQINNQRAAETMRANTGVANQQATVNNQRAAARQQYNNRLQNNANQFNLQNDISRQRANTDLVNRQQTMNNTLAQQRYNNQMNRAQAINTSTQGQQNFYKDMAGAAAASQGGMMKGLMGGAQAGSAFGPWGALIGAGVGAVSGGNDTKKANQYYGSFT